MLGFDCMSILTTRQHMLERWPYLPCGVVGRVDDDSLGLGGELAGEFLRVEDPVPAGDAADAATTAPILRFLHNHTHTHTHTHISQATQGSAQ